MKRSLWISALTGALAVYNLRRWLAAYVLKLSPPRYRVRVERRLAVPMHDGVALATDHYEPRQSGPFPTILIRSPYGARPDAGFFGIVMSFLARCFAERGYHVITQDVRGRFDSGGAFYPYFNERNDGLDTVAWIEAQPWFNGQIGLWGPSYLGIAQWLIADSPSVKALVPSVTGSKLHTILYPDGALDLGLALRWLALFQALDNHSNQMRLNSPRRIARNWPVVRAAQDRTARLLAVSGFIAEVESKIAPAFGSIPPGQADEIALGQRVGYYQDWLQHPDPRDPLWQEALSLSKLEAVTAPVHLIGGWYDFFLRALLEDYTTLKAAGRTPYLTIGPWQHFSNAFIMPDTLADGLIWFDAHLKGNTQRLRAKPVHIFVMGANEWRDLDTWPPPAQERRYYLRAGGKLLTEFPSEDSAADHYRYDPADPTPAVGGTQFSPWGGPVDNRALARRADVLVYISLPLEMPLEIIGPVMLELYVRSSLPYTDFFGRLCDVHPNGRSTNLCDGLFRLEPGKGHPCEDGSTRIQIDLWFTAHRFRRGHCLQLLVSSGAHPRWNRNPGTSDPSGAVMQAAEQTLYLDRHHPAALVVPVPS